MVKIENLGRSTAAVARRQPTSLSRGRAPASPSKAAATPASPAPRSHPGKPSHLPVGSPRCSWSPPRSMWSTKPPSPGAVLSGSAIGWAMLALPSVRFTDQPQGLVRGTRRPFTAALRLLGRHLAHMGIPPLALWKLLLWGLPSLRHFRESTGPGTRHRQSRAIRPPGHDITPQEASAALATSPKRVRPAYARGGRRTRHAPYAPPPRPTQPRARCRRQLQRSPGSAHP